MSITTNAIHHAQFAAREAAERLLLAAYSDSAPIKDMRLRDAVEQLQKAAAGLGYRLEPVAARETEKAHA